MKSQYKNLLVVLGAGLLLSSCGHRDILEDIVTPGQEVPVAYWEVGSTACKAGESFSFQGKYNVSPGKTAAYSEVWYNVNRDESAAVTAKLAGAAMAYTKTYTSIDEVRSYAPIVRFDHSQASLDDIEVDGDDIVRHYEYVIKGEVPVSRTLSPVSWADAETWDQERFDSYYPAGFAQEFCDEVIERLTADSTYYSSLRVVYCNYAFTNEQVASVNTKYGVNLPTDIDMTASDQGTAEKSDRWFSTTEASDDAITGYYYKTVENGVTYVHEVAKDVPTPGDNGALQYNGFPCYPVYKAADWVFCRYDDDKGAIISTVRAQYMPAFKELLTFIPFPDWIYDSTAKVYKVDFSRKYSLNAQFRVYDTDGEEGIATDVRVISVN